MAQGTTVRSQTGECPEARSMNGQNKKVTRKTEGRLLDLEQGEAPGQLPGDGTDGRRSVEIGIFQRRVREKQQREVEALPGP